MNVIGIDLHTNRFTGWYRNEPSSVDSPKAIETFDLNGFWAGSIFQNPDSGHLCPH
ncbi:MAG: hypothetical protein LBP88_05855 [Treponema sp.]|nr:hypothetical protein [Treponema sp.]